MNITGSNKNIQIKDDKFEFEFSDRFSLFDVGAFPFELKGKGKAQRKFAITCDKFLKKHCKTAFLSYDPLTQIYFDRNAFIPIEFIFRLGTVPGSSYLKRFPNTPVFNLFENPILEFSTKLEDVDRMIDLEEAKSLSPHPIAPILELIPKLARGLSDLFASAGFELWDGKFEFAYQNGTYYLIDAVTQDELRFTYKRNECSKEVIRAIYRDTPWFKNGKKGEIPVLQACAQNVLVDIYQFSADVLADKKNEKALESALLTYKEHRCRAF